MRIWITIICRNGSCYSPSARLRPTMRIGQWANSMDWRLFYAGENVGWSRTITPFVWVDRCIRSNAQTCAARLRGASIRVDQRRNGETACTVGGEVFTKSATATQRAPYALFGTRDSHERRPLPAHHGWLLALQLRGWNGMRRSGMPIPLLIKVS